MGEGDSELLKTVWVFFHNLPIWAQLLVGLFIAMATLITVFQGTLALYGFCFRPAATAGGSAGTG